MMENEQFELGRLTGEVRNLMANIHTMSDDIREMRTALEGLKIWKGQVMVASGIASFVSSGAFYLLGVALNRWFK